MNKIRFSLLLVILLFISNSLFSQKVKVNSKTIISRFIEYPEKPFGFEYLGYYPKLNIDQSYSRINIGGKTISEIPFDSAKYSAFVKSIQSIKPPLGNLDIVNPNISDKKGVLEFNVTVKSFILSCNAIEYNFMSDSSNKNTAKNDITLEIPMSIKIIDVTNSKILFDDEYTAKTKGGEYIAEYLFIRDEFKNFSSKGFLNKSDASNEARRFFGTKSNEIALSFFDYFFNQNYILESLVGYNSKYKLKCSSTGVLFLNFFKDDKNPTFIEYNQKTQRLKDLAGSEIPKIETKDGLIPLKMRDEANSLGDYFMNEIAKNTDEIILETLKTNAFAAYFVGNNYDKALILFNELNAKGKLNTNLNQTITKMKDYAKNKDFFEKNRNNLSATYSQVLFKMK